MSSYRIQQLNELIRKELAAFLVREGTLPPGTLVTVTTVKTSRDLSSARVTVSVLPIERREEIRELLTSQARHLQYELSHLLVIRRMPALSFAIDTALDKTSRIDALIDKIHHDR